AGERVLLPEVRKADADTIIVADGFSCREQIEQETDRKGLHIAQVLQMAIKKERTDLEYPENKYVDGMKLNAKPGGNNHQIKIAAAIAGVVIGALAVGLYLKRK
ncbi:MAG: hypothetical protein ACTHJ8_12185, partial [Mucilaginibacter sp.]